jgi:hypothetical protein
MYVDEPTMVNETSAKNTKKNKNPRRSFIFIENTYIINTYFLGLMVRGFVAKRLNQRRIQSAHAD